MKSSWVLAALAALHALPAWADTYSFAAVKDAGVSAADVAAGRYGYTDATLLADTSVAGAAGTGNAARAQTLPGVNRVEVSNSVAVSDEHIRQTGLGGPFAVALSGWTDDFTITGGSGAGTARLSINLTGRFGLGYGSSGGYGMWVATPQVIRTEVAEFLAVDPTTWLLETVDDPEGDDETLVMSYLANVLKPGQTDDGLSLPGGSEFGGVLTAEIPFVYGQAFAIASALFGFANDFGSLSAMNSAHFGISVLDNEAASITTASGAAYAAAVPEPQVAALLLAGLAVLGGAAARGRGRRTAA
ncbi:MAG: hypothetical protein HZB72_05060 [Burkholderiales bacterium]|nr:hypothetical protein [Burkholderiales bacterium]